MAALNISMFLLVYFEEHFANGTCTILVVDEADYGPGVPHKSASSITGERCSIYKRQSNRLLRMLLRSRTVMKHLRGVLISTDLDFQQREASGLAAQHLFPMAARKAACCGSAVSWHSSSCSQTKGAFI